ncbi:MAG: type II toxin-antitoxin system VapC family toxin [Sediminibacterium sp.]|nr:MAG: type II toxin-antitoxin system VapC family toxin [Sediminibacterium sp.]
MKVLIDTHVFIWLDTQPEKLSKVAIEICQDTNNQLYLSMASIWEMQIKVQLGKLNLNVPLAEMVMVQKQENDLNIIGIELEHIYQLQKLPFFHNDPFDRIIMAQSIIEEMPIVSVDENFKKYDIAVLW